MGRKEERLGLIFHRCVGTWMPLSLVNNTLLVPRTHPVGLPLTRWDPSPGLFDIKPWAPSSLPPFLKDSL